MAGHCFWEKTTNGCKNKDDTFNHNAYDFYALCRQNEKDAEYQCNKPPHKLNAGQCEDRPKETGAGAERSSGHEHSPKKKYCFDCTRSTYIFCFFNAYVFSFSFSFLVLGHTFASLHFFFLISMPVVFLTRPSLWRFRKQKVNNTCVTIRQCFCRGVCSAQKRCNVFFSQGGSCFRVSV